MAKIIKLIYTEERRGTGTDTNPVYLAPQLWTVKGKLVADCQLIDGKMVTYFYNENL